ncbi:MAG: isocitrate lyase/PEP mutase family protein [Candidatus Latescibacterota bacterium]
MKKPDLVTLLKGRKIILAPGAYDAFSARLIARQGFPAVYLTGSGVTASLLGRPDLGFVALPDMCGVVRNICQTIDIPLIADAESGFGNAVNLTRTVREYEMAGASAIHLEDQIVPKRFGGEKTPQVVPMEEHASKIRLAVKSRTHDSFLIIGRTDCIGRYGLDEAVRRGNAYGEAGADIVFVHGMSTVEELREVGRSVHGPKLINYTALTLSDMDNLPTMEDLGVWGYALVIFAIEPLFAAAKGLSDMLKLLATGDPTAALRQEMIALDDFNQMLDTGKFQELEDLHLPRRGDSTEKE